VEAYAAALIVQASEAEGDAGGVFDEAVGAFGSAVGDAGFQEAEDLGPPGVDGFRQPGGFRDVDQTDRLVETVQPVGDRVPVPGGEQLPQQLLSVN